MGLRDWLSANFSVQNIKGSECLLVCPACNRPKLYFNVSKKIGYCHYAGCDYHTRSCFLRDLQEHALGWPSAANLEEDGDWGSDTEERVSKEVVLPESAIPLVDLVDGEYIPRFPIASSAVAARGVSVKDQYRFDIQLSSGRIVIPIWHDGVLVQWIARVPWWIPTTNKMKYMYASGPKVGNYLFNYGEMRSRPYLTLVENTYNSIWLRNILNTTSIFGSNLTDEQVKLITRSAAQKVLIMFDEGAEEKAEQAKHKLGAAGIPAAVVEITGQPDDHNEEWLRDVGSVHL